MTKKNVVTVNFSYSVWSSNVNIESKTKSVAKMRKIITNDIKRVIMNGDNHPEYKVSASKFMLNIPYGLTHNYLKKINVKFDDTCSFTCDELSKLLRTKNDKFEISCFGKIYVTIELTD